MRRCLFQIGIRTVNAVLVASLLTLSALLAAGIFVSTYDAALSATEIAFQQGIDDTRWGGEHAVQTITEKLMNTTLTNIHNDIDTMLVPAERMVLQIADYIAQFPPDETATWSWTSGHLRTFLWRWFRSMSSSGEGIVRAVEYLNLGGDPKGGAEGFLSGARDTGPHYLLYSENSRTVGNPPGGYHFLTVTENDGVTSPDWWHQNGSRWTAWRRRQKADCEDTLVRHPACVYGKLCDCAKLIDMYPCGTKAQMNFGALDISANCALTCRVCAATHPGDADAPARHPPPRPQNGTTEPVVNGSQWGCLPYGTVSAMGRRLLPASAADVPCDPARSVVAGTDVPIGDCCFPVALIGWSVWSRPVVQAMTVYPPGAARWYGLDGMGGPKTELMVAATWGAPWEDRVYGSRGGMIKVTTDVVRLSVALSSRRQRDLPAGYRMYIVTREHVPEMNVAIGEEPPPRRPVYTDMLVGVSDGDAFLRVGTRYWGEDGTQSNYTVPLFDVLHCTNATDPIIRANARNLTSLERGFDAVRGELLTWHHAGHAYFQRVSTVSGDEQLHHGRDQNNFFDVHKQPQRLHATGLNWRIVLLVPREAVMRDIDAEREHTAARVAAKKMDTVDDVQRGMIAAVSAVAAAAVALSVAAAAATWCITAPLVALQRDMADVAAMQLDAIDTSHESRLREVHNMQASFRLMVLNLMEYRTYLPNCLADNSASPDGDVRPSIPSPAAVATGQSERDSAGSSSKNLIANLPNAVHHASSMQSDSEEDWVRTLIRTDGNRTPPRDGDLFGVDAGRSSLALMRQPQSRLAFRYRQRCVVAFQTRTPPLVDGFMGIRTIEAMSHAVLAQLFACTARGRGLVVRFDAFTCLTTFVPGVAAVRSAVSGVTLRRHSSNGGRSLLDGAFLVAGVAQGGCFGGAVGTESRRAFTLIGTPVDTALRAAAVPHTERRVRLTATVLRELCRGAVPHGVPPPPSPDMGSAPLAAALGGAVGAWIPLSEAGLAVSVDARYGGETGASDGMAGDVTDLDDLALSTTNVDYCLTMDHGEDLQTLPSAPASSAVLLGAAAGPHISTPPSSSAAGSSAPDEQQHDCHPVGLLHGRGCPCSSPSAPVVADPPALATEVCPTVAGLAMAMGLISTLFEQGEITAEQYDGMLVSMNMNVLDARVPSRSQQLRSQQSLRSQTSQPSLVPPAPDHMSRARAGGRTSAPGYPGPGSSQGSPPHLPPRPTLTPAPDLPGTAEPRRAVCSTNGTGEMGDAGASL